MTMKPLTAEEQQIKNQYDAASAADKLRVQNAANDQLFQIVTNKTGTLPIISTIAAALLIIATFNQNLLPLTATVKVLISILILIVPVSLFLHLSILTRAQKRGIRLLEIYRNTEIKMKGFDRGTHEGIWILASIIFFVILCVLALIWGPQLCGY